MLEIKWVHYLQQHLAHDFSDSASIDLEFFRRTVVPNKGNGCVKTCTKFQHQLTYLLGDEFICDH